MALNIHSLSEDRTYYAQAARVSRDVVSSHNLFIVMLSDEPRFGPVFVVEAYTNEQMLPNDAIDVGLAAARRGLLTHLKR